MVAGAHRGPRAGCAAVTARGPDLGQSLLAFDAQMHEILRLCRNDRSAYNRTAREWTQRHASDTLLTSFESQSEKWQCRTRCLMWVAAQVELLHELPPGSLCDVWRTHVAARASAGFFPCSA